MTEPVNEELRALFTADQEDRRQGLTFELIERDRLRRERVAQLLAAGAAQSGEDYFHAAMLFQHGGRTSSYARAHELALRAADLGFAQARWLAAAAYDRWLMSRSEPQKYGTQYRSEEGRWVLWPVDPDTTDEERAEWNVPTLAAAQRRADELTRRRPPSR